jgi:hypothetical protein
MEANLEHIREGVDDLKTALAVHDSRVGGFWERTVQSQERTADAVVRVAECTDEIRVLVGEMRKNGGTRASTTIMLDRKMLKWLIGIALLGAVAIGGGQEVAVRILGALLGTPR